MKKYIPLLEDMSVTALDISYSLQRGRPYVPYNTSNADKIQSVAAYLTLTAEKDKKYDVKEINEIKARISTVLEDTKVNGNTIDKNLALEISDRLLDTPFKFDWSNKKESFKQMISVVQRSIEDVLGMHKDVIAKASEIGAEMRKLNESLQPTKKKADSKPVKETGVHM